MTNSDRAKELTAQIPEFKIGGENGPREGRTTGGPQPFGAKSPSNSGDVATKPSGPSQPPSDKSDIPTLRLHDYARAPWKLAIAQSLSKDQGGVCPDAQSGPDHVVCEGLAEIHHRDGNPNHWDYANLALLCLRHHRIRTNLQRTEARRHSASVCVKNAGVSFDGAGLSPRSVSLEDDKHENYTARFDRAAPAYFGALTWDSGESPVVSIRTFRRAMIGALAYTDEAGRKHRPSQVTIDRYIDADIFPDNPDGRFAYAQTKANEDGIRWAAKRPESAKKEEKELEP